MILYSKFLILKHMTGTTHQMIALVLAFFTLTLFPVSAGPLLGILAVVAVMVGALTPDLDQPTANIWKRLIGGNVIGNIFNAFSGGHRHFTHSLLGIFLIAWAARFFSVNIINPSFINEVRLITNAFLIGYVSHPLADTFTDRGVPWLWPLKIHVKIPPGPEEFRVTTNSFVEKLVVRSGLIVIAVLLLQSYFSILKNFFS